jgi:hypothetical protein
MQHLRVECEHGGVRHEGGRVLESGCSASLLSKLIFDVTNYDMDPSL